jgi:hypothetical protein
MDKFNSPSSFTQSNYALFEMVKKYRNILRDVQNDLDCAESDEEEYILYDQYANIEKKINSIMKTLGPRLIVDNDVDSSGPRLIVDNDVDSSGPRLIVDNDVDSSN